VSLPNLRLAAARVYLPRGARRRAIEELFARTAAAFGSPVPPPQGRGTASRLVEYARFTRERAEEALERGAGGGPESLAALERRLHRAARGLGGRYRLQLAVRSPAEALAAARVIYRGLGIDFRGTPDGQIVIRRCSFAAVYTPRVCALVSALDRGLLAGLSGGGELRFDQRLTEGACCCRAHFEGNGIRPVRPRAIVVGSGAGGAAAARELQGTYQVTVLEGPGFSPENLSVRWMVERLRTGAVVRWGVRRPLSAIRARAAPGAGARRQRRHRQRPPERRQRPAPGRAAARAGNRPGP
jgi:hypothetical protein